MLKKILRNLIIAAIVIFLTVLCIYYIFFYPKTQGKSINSNIQISSSELINKFYPKEIHFSLNELSIESSVSFSSYDITDLLIYAINQSPDIKPYIDEAMADISDGKINLYFNLKYNGIPFQTKLIFSTHAENGKAIFHYESGKIGFIPISKEIIFKRAKDSLFLQFDENNADIIFSIGGSSQLSITYVSIYDNLITFNIKGAVKSKTE